MREYTLLGNGNCTTDNENVLFDHTGTLGV